jgi:tRNA threonylcarbamoyl adenosine modification protein (Sua5/YciO/YrdC/YwlC family)
MSQYFEIHPRNPQPRLIQRAVDVVRAGGLIVYPTDSAYALGCQIGNKHAQERILRIRALESDHQFGLVCADISEAATFAKIDNEAFRLIKSMTPGPFTFILNATREVPRRLLHPKRKSIGIRLPDNEVSRLLVAELGEPLLSSTLLMAGDEDALSDPETIRERLDKEVDLIMDAGAIPYAPTTIVGLTGDAPEIIRQGKGIVPVSRNG